MGCRWIYENNFGEWVCTKFGYTDSFGEYEGTFCEYCDHYNDTPKTKEEKEEFKQMDRIYTEARYKWEAEFWGDNEEEEEEEEE